MTALVNVNTATFNSTDLPATVPGLTILACNPYNPAKRNLTLLDVANASKSKANSGFYNKRPITLRIGITQTTRDLCEQSLDTLLGLLQPLEKDLIVRQSGGTRKFNCSYSDMLMRVEGGSYLEADIIFETSDHFGYDQNDTLLVQTLNYTSSSKTDRILLGGSAQWQAPKVIITLNSFVGSTSNTISFGNDDTGQLVSITRAFAAGDVIEIDSLLQSVKINGVESAFSGAIPQFASGQYSHATYSDDFTSRKVSYRMTYKRRFV